MAKSSFLRAAIAIEPIFRTMVFPEWRATGQWNYQPPEPPITHYFILRGTAKADRLTGGHKPDYIYGRAGNDRLIGQAKDDSLDGGLGHDRLYGRHGNDILDGGNQNDHLWGGRGRDIFVLEPGKGVDRIYDFNPSFDRLQVKGELSFRDLKFEVQGKQTQIFYTHKGQPPQLLAILIGRFDLQRQHFVGLRPSEPPPPPPIPATTESNQVPTVVNSLNVATTEDDAILQVSLLQGATDADGDTLSAQTVTWISGDAGGVTVTGDRLALNPSQYNHLAVGETEVIQYEYLITDGQGGQVAQRVTITITGANDLPVAQPDAIQTTLTALAPVALTGNLLNDNGSGQDIDPDGDTLQIIAVNGTPVGQALTLTSGASLTIAANGSFQYGFTDLDALKALGQTESTTDTVTYTLSDGKGGETTATATFRINGMNDAPIAQADSFSGVESTDIFGNLLDNNGNGADSDPDGDTLSISAINGTALTDLESGLALTLASGAVLHVFGDGRFSYSQLGQLASGAIASDQFTYTVSDGNGETATATVDISMTGENESPDAQDDTLTTNEATPISGNVLADNSNGIDSDADNDALTVTAVNGEPTNVGQEITLASGALLTLNADGSFDYDPNGQFESLTAGEVGTDSFTYWVSDDLIARQATVTLEIVGQNDAPSALTLSTMEVGEDIAGATIGNVSLTDPDSTYAFTVDDARFEVVNGQLKLKTGISLDFDNAADRTIPITITATEQNPPDPNAPQSLSQSFTIAVRQTNQAPIAQNDAFTTNEATAISLNVFADNGNGIDSDPNTSDILQVIEVNGKAIALNQPITLTSGALLTLTTAGQFTYDPNGKFDHLGAADSTTDSFTYTVSDEDGSTDTATVILNINGLNSLPNPVDDQFTVAENETISGNVLINNGDGADSDPEGATLAVSAVNGEAANVGQPITLASGVLLTLNADGSFDYNPNGQFDDLNAWEPGTDSFTYEVSDGVGGTRSATVTLAIAGRTSALTLADLEQSDNGMGFVIYGAQTGAYSGFAISMAGDVNQDGYADLLIGAPGTDGGSLPDNVTSDFTTSTSSVLSASLFSIDAIAARDASGDNDGLVCIDAINGTSTSSSSPSVTLSSGAIVTIDYLSSKGTLGGFTYNPNNHFSLVAGQVATDSFSVTYRDDTEASGTTVQVEVAILGGADMGAAYIVYGKADNAAVNLSSLGSGGITFSSDIDNSQVGFAVQGGQDINGDNIPDLIVGAPFATAQSAYAVFNLTSNGNQVSLGSTGFLLNNGGSETGYAVSMADLNGNGLADLIVSAPSSDTSQRGKVWVAFDPSAGTPIDLSTLADDANTAGFVIRSNETSINLFGTQLAPKTGRYVDGIGDFNGDGYADLAIGKAEGVPHIVFGKTDGTAITLEKLGATASNEAYLTLIPPANDLLNLSDFIAYTRMASIAGGGDVNGDGLADVLVSSPFDRKIYLVHGTSDPTSITLDTVGSSTGGFILLKPSASNSGGISTSGYDGTPGIQGQTGNNTPKSANVFSASIVGDINGDGLDDLIVNFNGDTNTNADTLYVVFGRTETTTINLDETLSSDVGFVLRNPVDSSETAIAFFEGRAAGDVNGDGLADILIGAPFTDLDDSANDNAGKSYVLFGTDFTGAISQRGDDGDNILTGTSAADALIGGRGNDTLQGAGGQDVLYGGAGNDVMSIADLQFQRIDGGLGEDTLALTGSDLSLDMATVRGLVRQIERIDLTGTGDNDLNITLRDLANLSDSSNRLIVIGDAGDSLTSLNQDWVLASATPKTVTGLNGLTFQNYTNGFVELWVDQRMTTILGTTLRDQTFTLNENSENTALVGQVQVSSLNGATVTNYQILSGNDTGAFAVDSSGNLRVADRTLLDFETTPTFTLTLQITDSEGFIDTGTVTVSLADQNDTPILQNLTTASLAEHSAVGTVIGTAIATDQDAGDSLTYSLIVGNDQSIFAIDATTGKITIANSARFNYESQTSHTLTVRATDLDGAFAETNFTVNLENQNRLIYDRTLTFNANSVSQWGDALDGIAAVIEAYTAMIDDQVNAVMPAQLWGLSNQFALKSAIDLYGGNFSASLPIDVRVVLPDGITPGQTIVVRSGAKLRDTATLNASTPGADIELGLDLSIDYSASFDLPDSLGGSVPAFFNGGTSADYSIPLPIPDRVELLNESLLSVEGAIDFSAPVLTTTTSQVNLPTSSLSTQMEDEDWVDLSIEGDVSTFNLWETLLSSVGLPQGVQVNAGDSSITFDVADTLSSGKAVPSAGTIAGNPTVSWSEDDGWSVQYTVSNSPITTISWTGDQWQGDFTANYSASKLNSLLGAPLAVIREAKTTYSYNLFSTDLDPRLGINQNLNLRLATMQGTLTFTELSETDPNRTATFTSGVVDGDLTSDYPEGGTASQRLSATLIDVPLNADANGDGVVEVSTQVSPTIDYTNYTELTYGLDYAITAGDSSTVTTIKYSKTNFDLLKSLNEPLYWSLKLNANSFSQVREGLTYNGQMIVVTDEYYLATYDKGTIPPALSVTGNVDVIQPIISGYQPDVGTQDAFTAGTQLENHLSYLVGEDETALTQTFALSSGGSTAGYSFSLTSQPSLGTVVNNNDGSFTFSLGSNFQFLTTGDYEDVSFTYTATNGTTTDSGTITVIVAGDDGQFNLYQDKGSVAFYLWDKTTLDLTAATYVITHGWGDGGHTDDDFRDLAKGIQTYAPTANILFTDWTDLSSNLNYSEAADDTFTVGTQLGTFLRDANFVPSTTTLIGHSLGAHVSGIAGDTYDTLTGMAVAQIIGLDPAGPLFESPGGRGVSERLDPTDGDRVIAFHTSNTLGYDGTLADLDLYVNWDDLFQPGKSSFLGNHSYPIELLSDLYQGAGYLQPSNGSVFDLADLSTFSGSVNIDTTTAV